MPHEHQMTPLLFCVDSNSSLIASFEFLISPLTIICFFFSLPKWLGAKYENQQSETYSVLYYGVFVCWIYGSRDAIITNMNQKICLLKPPNVESCILSSMRDGYGLAFPSREYKIWTFRMAVVKGTYCCKLLLHESCPAMWSYSSQRDRRFRDGVNKRPIHKDNNFLFSLTRCRSTDTFRKWLVWPHDRNRYGAKWPYIGMLLSLSTYRNSMEVVQCCFACSLLKFCKYISFQKQFAELPWDKPDLLTSTENLLHSACKWGLMSNICHQRAIKAF